MTRLGPHGGPDLDDQVELTLALARVAREPSLADKQRVLEALAPHLDATPSLLEEAATSGVREVAAKGSASYGSALARLARPFLSVPASVQHLVWVGAVTGGLGFWLGTQHDPPAHEPAGSEQRTPREVHEADAPAQPAPAHPPLAPSASASRSGPPAEARPAGSLPRSPEPSAGSDDRAEAAEPRAPAGAVSDAPRMPAPEPTPAGALPLREGPRAPAARPSSQRRTPARGPVGGVTSAGPSEASSAGNTRFLEAVRLLQQAQRSIEGGEPSVALALLAELEARYPEPLLTEERLATRVLALCESGDLARAQQAAAELATRNASSIYAARVAQSCAGRGVIPPRPR